MSSDGILTVTVPKTTSGSKASAVSEASTSQVSQTSSQNTEEKQTLTKKAHSQARTQWTTSGFPSPRRSVFSDSFFEDVRKDFETAVNEVLSRHDIMRSANDELSCYRSLRERELKDETQAMKTTEDQHGFKVVLDVHDFMNEDVKVKVVDNKEVVVEGRAEKNDGTLRSSKSFCRRFTLPGAVDMNAVTSAMSSDGVLTITAPKIANKKGTQNNTTIKTPDMHSTIMLNITVYQNTEYNANTENITV
nr:alpha-crystallin A chain-like [Penaeus vannamei]